MDYRERIKMVKRELELMIKRDNDKLAKELPGEAAWKLLGRIDAASEALEYIKARVGEDEL